MSRFLQGAALEEEVRRIHMQKVNKKVAQALEPFINIPLTRENIMVIDKALYHAISEETDVPFQCYLYTAYDAMGFFSKLYCRLFDPAYLEQAKKTLCVSVELEDED